ncbi:MAG: OmpA family protein [Pseudomonadales bacterium]
MRLLSTVTLLLLALGWASHSAAEGGPEKGQFTISLLGGAYQEPDDTDLRTGDESFGGALGWAPTDRISIEAMWFDFEPGIEVGGIRAEGEMDYWSLNLITKVGNPTNWQPYIVVGGGRGEYEYRNLRSDSQDNLWHGGIGFFSNLNSRLAFRADVRGVYHNEADDITPMATVGLTLMLGGRSAPPPAPAPAPAAPVDSDGDGVVDGSDRCPNTPAGVQVDSRGCPLDSDGDGVPDHRDACPGTPAGAKVDERGCEVKLEKPVSFNLTVQFALNSAEITGVGMQEMFDLLRFLRQYPSATAVIEGHTDSSGATDYNQGLSERRAQAVVQAITNSGIGASRLTARGYGESRPIASNDTAEGRAQNRRVTVVVSGTTME